MNIKINLNNKYRVLLTELLPYEIPLMLNNEGFYDNVQDDNLRKIFHDTFINNKITWTIPFDYTVRKYSGDKSRKLSLMHPFLQLEFADFYAEYDSYMISLCANSPFSIRHIEECAKCIFKKEGADGETYADKQKRIEVMDDEIETYYRSYFSYKKYDMMYKFFTSGDYLRLEQKYTHLMKMDIANCFYHIYTHTISWAVKGKELAKASINVDSFENKFDKLMQQSNYNETNGIIVGPEVSRIFAEIILQRIDINVLNRLKQLSLNLGRDYEVRRYVDDHYIYANSEEILGKILEVYKEELSQYKLFVNESKLEFIERPFTTDISDAKREINSLVSDISNRWLKKDEGRKYVDMRMNEMKEFSSIVNVFRSLSYRSKQKYGVLNRYMLALLVSQIQGEMRKDKVPDAYIGLLLMYTEVAFYVFSLDMSVSASIKLCRILECLHSWAEACSDKTILPELENRIYRETKRCLDIYETSHKDNDTNIEVLNIVLCLSCLMSMSIPRMQLMKLFNISEPDGEGYKKLNYFQICTLLYIIGKDNIYEDIRQKLVKEINDRLCMDDALKHADNAMLFFDIMTCPYIDKKEVKQLIMKIYNCQESTCVKKYKELTRTRRWFFCWDKPHRLSELLSKKEYHSPYE